MAPQLQLEWLMGVGSDTAHKTGAWRASSLALDGEFLRGRAVWV